MLLKTASVKRREMLDLASLSIESADREGRPFVVRTEARRLLAAYPDCRMSFEELRKAIAGLAISARPWSLGP
jgi:hypothetical protein